MKVEPIGVGIVGAEPTQPTRPRFSNREKRDELAREINIRKVVYPGMIRAGRMTHAKAERQKEILHEIWQEYCEKCKEDEPELIGMDMGAGDDQTTQHVVGQDAAVGVATANADHAQSKSLTERMRESRASAETEKPAPSPDQETEHVPNDAEEKKSDGDGEGNKEGSKGDQPATG